MPRSNFIQTNFTAGELSPYMRGRVDVQKYQNGAELLKNFLVRKQGPISYRPGTQYVSDAKFGGRSAALKRTIIHKFAFSDNQEYVIELGEFYVRVWFDGGFVETAPGSGVPLEVVTPYAEADLEGLTFTQSADILYIFHHDHQSQKLERLGANSWALVPLVTFDGPYLSTPQVGQLTVSNVSCTANAVAFNGDVFTPGTVKSITGVTGTGPGGIGGSISLHVVAHGFNTNDNVTVEGLTYSIPNTGGTFVPANFPFGNGNYKVTKIDNDHVVLQGSVMPTVNPTHNYDYRFAGALIFAAGVGQYVEYRQDNVYKLAQILVIIDATHATVCPVANIKSDVPSGTKLTFTGGNTLTASNSGIFTYDDVGAFVKSRTDGNWYHITAYTSDTVVVAALVSVVSVVLPKFVTVSYDLTTTPPGMNTSEVTYLASADVQSDTPGTFAATDVGRHLRFNFGGKQPWAIITVFTDDQHVSIQLYAQIPPDPTNVMTLWNNGVTQLWRIGAFSDTSGWPSVGAFHEQRLWLANTRSEPQTINGSKSADFQNFAPTTYDSVVTDDSGVTYTLASTRANPILWMVSGPTMLIGTLGAEYQVKASTLGAPITPTNITILPQTNHGSLLECEPFRIGYAVVFVQRAGNKLIELTYEFTLDSYVGKDLSITSDHIMRQDGGAHRTAYAQEPNSIIWICLNDGTLASVTYEREQQVAAWQEHALGGIAHVESICSVSEGNVDILYMVVLRSIGGVQCRTIERLTPDFFPSSSTDRSGMWHLDCALQYVGVPVQTVAVGHLAVDPVTVVADGAVLPSAVIVAGVITLPEPASNVIVGYSYTGTMRVLPVEGQSPSGTQQGKIKRINKLTLRLWNSLEFKHGYDLNKLDVESFRDIPTGPMDASPPFFTGDRTVNTSMEYSRTGQFYIVQDHPYPLNLLAIVPQEGLYEQ